MSFIGMSSKSYVRYDFIACLTWHIYCPLEQHRLNINCIKKSLWPYLAYLIFRKSQNLFINFLAFFRYIIQTTRFCITALICYEIASSLKSIKKNKQFTRLIVISSPYCISSTLKPFLCCFVYPCQSMNGNVSDDIT